jgi:NAD(P)-dependent dehydrogenase (short-subunit alcohol dehydrogenase family)
MDLELRGKRALVTGGSKGIGRAVAERLAEEGCDLVIVSRTAEALEAVAADIRSRFQVGATVIPADLSRQDEVERVAATAGDIDILVNNAGAIPRGDLLALDNAAFRAAWDLKVFGYISMCRAFYERLKARRGAIVNVIGAASDWLDPDYIAGSVGNAALVAFTTALGKAAARDGFRVAAVNPGSTATDRMVNRLRAQAADKLGDADRWEELTRSLPYGRAIKPEEIAAAVAFLASPLSAYTTSAVLKIDGGLK